MTWVNMSLSADGRVYTMQLVDTFFFSYWLIFTLSFMYPFTPSDLYKNRNVSLKIGLIPLLIEMMRVAGF